VCSRNVTLCSGDASIRKSGNEDEQGMETEENRIKDRTAGEVYNEAAKKFFQNAPKESDKDKATDKGAKETVKDKTPDKNKKDNPELVDLEEEGEGDNPGEGTSFRKPDEWIKVRKKKNKPETPDEFNKREKNRENRAQMAKRIWPKNTIWSVTCGSPTAQTQIRIHSTRSYPSYKRRRFWLSGYNSQTLRSQIRTSYISSRIGVWI